MKDRMHIKILRLPIKTELTLMEETVSISNNLVQSMEAGSRTNQL